MNKQQLASKIWESANKMRSKIEANEYKDYILGFIFYKFLSEKEEEFLKNNDVAEEDMQYLDESDLDTVKFVQNGIGYFIEYKSLFSTWIKKGKDFDVSDVNTALSAFTRLVSPNHKKVFDGIFTTLETGLSKLGDTSGKQTKAISDLIQLIKDIPMDKSQDYDVLGFIYEYLISNFAANAGKKAGEFYTPHEVSLLMSEIVANHLKDRDEIKIYDPTSGSGSLLINIGKSSSKYIKGENKIKYYAQELKQNTYNLTRMNLIMRGILPDNIVTRNGDTLEEDWPYFDESDRVQTYDPLYVDAVVSNPPYSQKWDPTDKENDPRYANYGLAPKSKADYAFLLHDLYHIKPDGIMSIVLPHGVLFRGGEEGVIRKNLIEKNHIDTIIGLPANIFFGTGIPTIIMILKQKRVNNDVLIIDASKGFVKEGKNNKLQASHIKKILNTVIKRENIDKFSRVVSLQEIKDNDYNLNIPRYVDSSEKAETYDIYSTMFGGIPANEVEDLSCYWDAFTHLKEELFNMDNKDCYSLKIDNVKDAVLKSEDVLFFLDEYKNRFSGFIKYLENELIVNMETCDRNSMEDVICDDIFKRLENIKLIDKYKGYQSLDDIYHIISTDLEIIQTEGKNAIRQVDPNMVIKKKGDKEEEVQQGWLGHVIPFDLIQKTILKDQLDELTNKQNQLNEIASRYEELLEEFNEEDKSEYSDQFNEDNTAFVIKEVSKITKILNKTKDKSHEELRILDLFKKVEKVNNDEKALKKEVKSLTEMLEKDTKITIESLTEIQINELLNKKWIAPLYNSLLELANTEINLLVTKLDKLSKKYETTYSQLTKEIYETELLLSEMLDELTGSEHDMLGILELKKLLGGD